MNEALFKINELISDLQPDDNDITNNNYLEDLSTISNLILKDDKSRKERDRQMLNILKTMPESEGKNQLINILFL